MPAAETKSKWSYVLDEPTRILVVDDDPILLEFASVYLSTPVARVETASDGGTALDLMLKGGVDIALIDIEMPGINGFELVERVRAHEILRHLPLVMLTGREDIASIDRAYSVGATSFVTKPVNWRQLSYQLRYVLRASRMEAELRRAHMRAEENAALKSMTLRLMEQECRTTMTSIIAFAELIAAGGKPHLPNALVDCTRSIATAGQDLLCKILDMTIHAELTTNSSVSVGDSQQLPHLRDEARSSATDHDENPLHPEAAA